MRVKFVYFLLFITLLIVAGCNKETDPTGPGSGDEFPAAPKIAKIYPSVALANGYIYLEGENFGSTSASISVKFRSKATQQAKTGTIVEVTSTKITVRVPGDIDTTSAGNEIVVETPKGSVVSNATVVYGITTSAFGDSLLPGKGFIGQVYQLIPNTSRLPNFDTMQVKSVLLAPNLDVPVREFSAGFPGVPGGLVEWFGIRFSGKLIVQTAGSYDFTIGSDDGSKLYINDSLVVENDGTHAYFEKSGKIQLPAGEHKIRVDYFQGPRFNIAMRLFWTAPGGSKQIIPAASIKLPDFN
jgi:hypothetical protein